MLATGRNTEDPGSTVLAFWPNRYRSVLRVPILMTNSAGAATNGALPDRKVRGIYITEIPLQVCV
jgi:hypothetical protein